MAELIFDAENARVLLKGRLKTADVMQADKAFNASKHLASNWEINGEQLTEVDSSSIALLLEWQKDATAHQQKLRFSKLPENMLNIARLSQMQSLLK